MAYDHVTLRIPGLKASGDLSGNQFYAVKPASTAGAVKVVTAASDNCIGVLYNEPASGEAAEVASGGVLKGKAGGTIGAGALVSFNSSGKLVAANSTANIVIGYAVESASADDVFPFVWQRSRY
ncbi:MAG: DUF2190 family protein [Anaerolineae bacterium]|nr:DUF2190 family protein [Anaerolineae bacterium]